MREVPVAGLVAADRADEVEPEVRRGRAEQPGDRAAAVEDELGDLDERLASDPEHPVVARRFTHGCVKPPTRIGVIRFTRPCDKHLVRVVLEAELRDEAVDVGRRIRQQPRAPAERPEEALRQPVEVREPHEVDDLLHLADAVRTPHLADLADLRLQRLGQRLRQPADDLAAAVEVEVPREAREHLLGDGHQAPPPPAGGRFAGSELSATVSPRSHSTCSLEAWMSTFCCTMRSPSSTNSTP
jgi:hypothetical protein